MFAVRKNAGYDLLGYLRSVEQRGSEVKFVILAICTGERETPECGWGDHPKLFDQMCIRRLLPCVANRNKTAFHELHRRESRAHLQVVVSERVCHLLGLGEVYVDSGHRTYDAQSTSTGLKLQSGG